jgi:hypothetical protein
MINDSLVYPTIFELIVAVLGAVLTCGLALVYLRHVRLERPPIGTFNRRDITILFVFIVGLPLLYTIVPMWLLTTFLVLTFTAAMSIGYKPLMGSTRLWLGIGFFVGVNFWMTRTLLGTVVGWQVYWIENSCWSFWLRWPSRICMYKAGCGSSTCRGSRSSSPRTTASSRSSGR